MGDGDYSSGRQPGAGGRQPVRALQLRHRIAPGLDAVRILAWPVTTSFELLGSHRMRTRVSRRTVPVLALSVLLAPLIAACGGGSAADEGTPTAVAAPTLAASLPTP